MAPLLNNILSLAFLQGANYLLPLITLPFLVRTLGIDAFGRLSFGLAIAQYFVILTEYGFNLSATRAVAMRQENKKEVSIIFWSVVSCKLLLCCLGLVLIIICSNYFTSLKVIQPILFATYLLVLGNVLFPVWLFQGMEAMWHVTIASVIAKLLTLPAIFLFVSSSADSWLAALIQGMAPVAAGVISIFILWRLDWISWSRPEFAQIRAQFVDGWHVFISTGAVALYTATTTTLLGMLAGYAAVGQFTAADKIRQAVQGLVTPVSQALYPRINAMVKNNRAAAIGLIRIQLLWQGLATLILSITLGIFAPEMIELAYGADHPDMVAILRILSPLPFLVGLSNVLGIQTMLPLGMSLPFSRILLVSGTVNIVLVIPLSWLFAGAGAAVSVVVTESLVTLLMAIVVFRNGILIFQREKIVTP